LQCRPARTLGPGEQLFSEGETCEHIFLVQDGALKLTQSTSDGREQIIAFSFANDVIGRPFTCRMRHGATALSSCTLLAFKRADFENCIQQRETFLTNLVRLAFVKLDECQRLAVLLGQKNAEEKVASFLVALAVWQGQQGAMGADLDLSLDLPMSRQEIADFLGLTIETVSRRFSAMKNAGLIEFPGRSSVLITKPKQVFMAAG